MAYAAVITVRSVGDGAYELQIDETEAAAASETEISLSTYKIPSLGTIVLQEASLVSGTGPTISPQLGRITNATLAVDLIAQNATAAAQIRGQPSQPIPFARKEASWFHRARAAGGTDNVIRTIYRIQRG